VRAITAGVALDRLADRAAVDRALLSLRRARRVFEAEGYEVQTTRVTLPPRLAALDPGARRRALEAVRALDPLVTASGGTQVSLGPCSRPTGGTRTSPRGRPTWCAPPGARSSV
jgi:hypothetical protein